MRLRQRRIVAASAIAIVAAGMTVTGATGATGAVDGATVDSTRPGGASLLGPAPRHVGTISAARGAVLRARWATLSHRALTKDTERVSLDLFGDASYAASIESVTHNSPGSTSWSGTLDGGRSGSFHAVRVKGSYFLQLDTDQGVFEISQAAGDIYRVVQPRLNRSEVDDSIDLPVGVAARGSSVSPPRSVGAANARVNDGTLDILVAYTAAAVTNAGGQAPLLAQIQLGVDQANEAFKNSQIPLIMKLAGTMQTTSTETNNWSTDIDLSRVQNPTDGYYDDVPPMRQSLHADAVSLWLGGKTATGQTCGYGYYTAADSADPAVQAQRAYSIVQADCATNSRVFVHEVGHNLGADHDVEPGVSLSTRTKPYARGYFDAAASEVSIMSYYSACDATNPPSSGWCQRVPYFSNPKITRNGKPWGSATADNARVINENLPNIVAWGQSAILAGVPTITGKPLVGSTLTAAPGTWTPATLAFTYQWSADGTAIVGATGSSLTLGKTEAGKTITVTVTGSASGYAPVSATSAPTAKVAKPKIKFKVSLVGKAKVGGTLSAKAKSKVKKLSYRFTWYRGAAKIKGENGPSYRLKAADRGAAVYVKVVATKKGYAKTTKKSKTAQVS